MKNEGVLLSRMKGRKVASIKDGKVEERRVMIPGYQGRKSCRYQRRKDERAER
jgi:hypothetical protein